jgi:DNA-binding NarL/FixJ family response regulator
VLVLSAHGEPPFALQLIESNARGAGYLLKERVTDVDELGDAVRRVAAGGLVLDPSVVAQLVGRRRAHSQAICQRLHLSPKTVEAYVGSLFGKLGLQQDGDDNRRVLAVLTYLRA